MNKFLLALSEEAIAYQNPYLFNELTLIFSELKSSGLVVTDELLRNTRLSKVIKDSKNGLGLSVNFKAVRDERPNAYVVLPQIDINHPLLSNYRKKVVSNTDGKVLAKLNQAKESVGTVDRLAGKVTGPMSDIEFDLTLTTGLLAGDLTPDEVASVVLHELGHLFSYFECLGEALVTSAALAYATSEFLGTTDVKKRIKVLTDVEQGLSVNLQNKEELCEIQNGEVLQTVILKERIEVTRSDMGAGIFDMRAWEAASDLFASRMGASKSLTSALSKLYEGHASTYSTTRYLLGQLCVVLNRVFLLVAGVLLVSPYLRQVWLGVSFIFAAFAGVSQNPFIDDYDPPGLRMEKIKRDLLGRLKDPELPKEYVKGILEDIDAIENLRERMTDRETFWQKAWVFISPSVRGARRTYNKVQELEQLANNSLYVKAAELKSLT